jgi:hypothetical protein
MSESMRTNLRPGEDGYTIHDVEKIKVQQRGDEGAIRLAGGIAPVEEWDWEQGTEVSRRVEEEDGTRRVIFEEQ